MVSSIFQGFAWKDKARVTLRQDDIKCDLLNASKDCFTGRLLLRGASW
jgi:hypothetical protein